MADSPDIRNTIDTSIAACIASADAVTQTCTYRTPLVAYACADDPRFDDLASLVPGHLHPRDLLPAAGSVCVFFLPFAQTIVEANRPGEMASEVWAKAYVETNVLLAGICGSLVTALNRLGVRAAWEPPTHNFDPVRLVSAWSHKSVGAIAGLGQLGHHHMLITEAGCAGRLGSIVLDVDLSDAVLADGARPDIERMCAFDRGCRDCVRRCPVGALTEHGLDRQRCYVRCLENDARWPQWAADVCGKCATGPCALQPGGTG